MNPSWLTAGFVVAVVAKQRFGAQALDHAKRIRRQATYAYHKRRRDSYRRWVDSLPTTEGRG